MSKWDKYRTPARKEYEKQRKRDAYKHNPEKFIALTEKYKQEHPEKMRESHNRACAKYRAKDPKLNTQRSWRSSLKRYGWTPDLYKQKWMDQDGRCAICANELKESGWSPESVCRDHDHKTNSARGLLCNKCNKLLGCAMDNADILKSAITYLGGYSVKTSI